MTKVALVECPGCGAPVNVTKSVCDFCRTALIITSDGFSLRGVANIHLKKQVDEHQKAVRADPNDSKARLLLGVAYLELGLFRESERELMTAQKLNPDEPEIYYFLAVMTGRTKGWENVYVERYARKALQIAPSMKEAQALLKFSRAIASKDRSGALKEQIRAFEEALALDDDNTDILIALAYAYENDGNTKRATDLYARAVELNTEDKRAYVRLGLLMTSRGQYARARDIFERHMQLDPENEVVAGILEKIRKA